jgi:hypothetical protein
MIFVGAVWVKNLEQKLNLKIKAPTDEEITKLGGKSLEKYVILAWKDMNIRNVCCFLRSPAWIF